MQPLTHRGLDPSYALSHVLIEVNDFVSAVLINAGASRAIISSAKFVNTLGRPTSAYNWIN